MPSATTRDDAELDPHAGRGDRRAQKDDDVREVEDEPERGDEQPAARRHEQRRRRDDEDVERREGRRASVGDVDDRRDQQQIEDRLEI